MDSEVLVSISKDEVERARLLSEYKYELDLQSSLVDAIVLLLKSYQFKIGD
jgi:hypothetical protein